MSLLEVNRRQFLGNSARNAAGMAAGVVTWSGAGLAGNPNERVRLAVAGVRAQGLELAIGLAGLSNVEIVAVCDVDAGVLGTAAERVGAVQASAPGMHRDFRRLLDDRSIDGLVIATPDHWHASMCAQACAAGKDVYVETPVSHGIAEGPAMTAAARRFGRIVQTGLAHRSGAHFQSAVSLVKGGEIGDVRMARAWVVHRRKPIGRKSEATPPELVDYDRWLGPSPVRPFQPNRFHHNWQWFWDHGSGELGLWGVPLLDLARWGLGVGLPLRVSATGGIHYLHDDRETPDTLSVQYSYPKASIVWEHRQWSNHGIEGRSAAVAFYGDNGTLIVDRGGWKIYGRRNSLAGDATDAQTAHLQNFVDCIRSRATPQADIDVGQLSSTLCHLGNIAYRLGREVAFDPSTMGFGWDGEANALAAVEHRAPYGISLA